jgi:phosphate transport system substrate-binding protein
MKALSILAVLLVLSCCSEGGSYQKYTLSGSSTVAPLASDIARRYESLHPGVRIDIQSGGSSRGIADARDGSADIGMASRALTENENDLRSITIARDGVCIILHADNPLRSLTREQIVDLYSGRISNWSSLGGEDLPVVVVNKAAGRATLAVFSDYFHISPQDIAAHIIIGDNQEAIKTVANNPRAIAYVSVGAAEYDIQHGAALQIPAIDGIQPSTHSLSDGSYPVARPLNFIIAETPSSAVMDFINFARSKEVHDLVSAHYFVPAAP